MLHFNFADQYRGGASPVHHLDPRSKILGTFLFILVAALLPDASWVSFGLLLIAITGVSIGAGLGWGFALRRSFIALPFALAAVTLPFTMPGRPVGQLGDLAISAEGSLRFLTILVKSWISVQAAVLLTGTTAFPELLWGLRALRMPGPLIDIIGFMYRYLFVFADEALRLIRARASRSGSRTGKGGGRLFWRGRVAGGMVGSLTLRAFERSERIYDAMLARGYTGEIRILAPPVLTDADRSALVGWAAFLAMAFLIGVVF